MPSNRRRPGKRPRADPAPRAEKKKRAKAPRPRPAAARPEATKEPLEPEAAAGEVAAPEAIEAEGAAAEPEVLPPEGEEETTLPVRVERDLEHANALQRYMAEVSRHPLLSREEEHALAVRFRETEDPRIAYRLVTANLRLVVKIANEYRRAAFNLLDLIQEGNIGLMQAVQKYDPFRGFKPVPKLLAERLDVSEQDVREMDQRLANDEFSLDAPVAGADDARQTYAD